MMTLWVPDARRAQGAQMTPVVGVDGDAVGQAGGAVGERVEIGIGRVGVERHGVALGVGWLVMSVREDRRLVGVGHRPGELSVSCQVPSD